MLHDTFLGLDGGPWRSGLAWPPRSPARRAGRGHVAFVGGGWTLGRAVERPFPALVEGGVGVPCANLGVAGASAEAFLGDPAAAEACRAATLTVVEVTGAAGLSNPLYRVHPRRNDRFVRATAALREIYPEVDLAEVCFARHLLRTLHEAGPERFDCVREALRAAWVAAMADLLDRIGPGALLLWLRAEEGDPVLGPEPLFVTRAMVDALRPRVRAVVEVAVARGAQGDAAAHGKVAAALMGPVRAGLGIAPAGLRASR